MWSHLTHPAWRNECNEKLEIMRDIPLEITVYRGWKGEARGNTADKGGDELTEKCKKTSGDGLGGTKR